MWYEIKWSLNEFSFDWIWEDIKRKLLEKVLPWAKQKAEYVLKYIKEGVSDYIKQYWEKIDEKDFYLTFNGLFFVEPREKINEYKQKIERVNVKIIREEEIKIDKEAKPYICLTHYYVIWDDSEIRLKVELDCYKKEIQDFIYKQARIYRDIEYFNKRPLDDNLVLAFLEWRCKLDTLLLQCLWTSKL